jgi:hypothetical protein
LQGGTLGHRVRDLDEASATMPRPCPARSQAGLDDGRGHAWKAGQRYRPAEDPREKREDDFRLIYDEDPALAAAAIDLVREMKLWRLSDDLEQALAFRDVKDFAVFEAASYALAEYRLGREIRHAI